MIVTARELMEEYGDYSNPKCKVSRLVREGRYTRIVRGLYETDPETPGYLLCGFNGPSYISFEYALFIHNVIPESVFVFTNATAGTGKKKRYETPFGVYSYRDVPRAVFNLAVRTEEENGYTFRIATPEKAVCDQLYVLPPAQNIRELGHLVFDDQRMDRDTLSQLDFDVVSSIAPRYRCRNVSLFVKLLRRIKHA